MMDVKNNNLEEEEERAKLEKAKQLLHQAERPNYYPEWLKVNFKLKFY